MESKVCENLYEPPTEPEITLRCALIGEANQAISGLRSAHNNQLKIFWRLELIDLLACAQHYHGTDYRRELQAHIRTQLTGTPL